MRPETHILAHGTKRIAYHVTRKNRRTLQISVLPDMSVRVTAPTVADNNSIRQRVEKRARWILRQIDYFRQFHPRTPARSYLSGETHLYLGRRYRLKVVQSEDASVTVASGRITVKVPDVTDEQNVRKLLHDWQKQRALQCFHDRLARCMERFSNVERVKPKAVVVRELRTRWGSMSHAGRLTINRSLLQASVHEIDYLITHELCHRIHHHHGPKFFELLDRVMPDWETRKASLERRLS